MIQTSRENRFSVNFKRTSGRPLRSQDECGLSSLTFCGLGKVDV